MMTLRVNDRIRNRVVGFFNDFSLSLRYDSIASSFSFRSYFDPNNIEHKETFCIGHYHGVTLHHDKDLLLTGTITSEGFNAAKVAEMASFGGYSLPGVLEDCNIPPDLYPLQYDGLTLKEIAEKLIKPFGLKMIISKSVEALMDEAYPKTTAEPTQSIKEYITSLATQKGILVTHNQYGNVVFTKSNANKKPILTIDIPKGYSIPGYKISLAYDGQGMHSPIHVIKQASSRGGNAGEAKVINPYIIKNVYRPKVVVQNSGSDIDTEKYARMALAAELKSLKLIVVTDRWDINGTVIKPDNTITVCCPDAYIYKPLDWFIEEVTFQADNKEIIATLTCCPPEVYNDRTPVYPFRGINLH